MNRIARSPSLPWRPTTPTPTPTTTTAPAKRTHTTLLKGLHRQQPPHLSIKPTAARTLHSATLYLQWLKAGVRVLSACQDPGRIPERLERLYRTRSWKQDYFLTSLRKRGMEMAPHYPRPYPDLPSSSRPPKSLHHHNHHQDDHLQHHYHHHHHHQSPYMRENRLLVEMNKEGEEEEEVGEEAEEGAVVRRRVLQSSLCQCRGRLCFTATNTPSPIITPYHPSYPPGRGWGLGMGIGPRVEGGGREGVTKLRFPSPPSPPLPLLHTPSSYLYKVGERRGSRRGRGRGRKIMHEEEEVEQENSAKRRREERRDSGGGGDGCSGGRDCVVSQDPMWCGVIYRKPRSSTPCSPPHHNRPQNNPITTPTGTLNPPQSSQGTPTTPSFHTFIHHEIATSRNTTPLHELLNMGSFWSPQAPLTPYTPTKLEMNPPGTPTPARTPPTTLLSPWGEGVKLGYSPSMFTVQAAMLKDGASFSWL